MQQTSKVQRTTSSVGQLQAKKTTAKFGGKLKGVREEDHEGENDGEQLKRDLIGAMLISKKMSEFQPTNLISIEEQSEQPVPLKVEVRISNFSGGERLVTPMSTGKLKAHISNAFKERAMQKTFIAELS